MRCLASRARFGRQLRQPSLAIEEPPHLALEQIDVDLEQLLGERTDMSRVMLSVRSCVA